LLNYFGDTEAAGARAMIEADERQNKKEALDMISAAKKAFAEKNKDELPKDREEFNTWLANKPPRLSKLAICPACGEQCLLTGEKIASGEPRLEENEIVQETFVLPTRLACPFCRLRLESHASLHGADLGGQYSVKEYHDPVKFHGIDPTEYFDPADYFEPDYGND
jgi:hypothetical protein